MFFRICAPLCQVHDIAGFAHHDVIDEEVAYVAPPWHLGKLWLSCLQVNNACPVHIPRRKLSELAPMIWNFWQSFPALADFLNSIHTHQASFSIHTLQADSLKQGSLTFLKPRSLSTHVTATCADINGGVSSSVGFRRHCGLILSLTFLPLSATFADGLMVDGRASRWLAFATWRCAYVRAATNWHAVIKFQVDSKDAFLVVGLAATAVCCWGTMSSCWIVLLLGCNVVVQQVDSL